MNGKREGSKFLPIRPRPLRSSLALTHMSAKLFCKIHSLHLFRMGLFCKMDVEHRTSNVQHRIKKPGKRRLRCRTLNDHFFFFSAVLILATKILIISSVSCKISFSSTGFLNSVFSFFPIQNSMLDVRCSMFIFFSSSWPKNNLALMALNPCPNGAFDR